MQLANARVAGAEGAMAISQPANPYRYFARAAVAVLGGRWVLTSACFYTAALNVLALTGPAYTLILFGRVLPKGSMGELLALTGAAAWLYVLGAFVDLRRQVLLGACSRRAERRLAVLFSGRGERFAIARVLRGAAPAAICDAPWLLLYVAGLTLLHPLLGSFAVLAGSAVALCAVLSRPTGERQTPGGSQRELHAAAALRALRPALQSTTLGLGGYLVLSGSCGWSTGIAAAIVLPRVIGPIEVLALNWRDIAAANAAAIRLARSDQAGETASRVPAANREVKIVLRRSRDYALSATRAGTRSTSSDLRPTAQ